MPLGRYFLFVGGVLLALLFVANAALPGLPAAEQTVAASADFPVIRIHSDRKWPERIVFDTSVRATVPTLVARTETATTAAANTAASAPAPITVAEFTAKAHVREAFAQFRSSGPEFKPSNPARTEAAVQPVQRKPKIAKRHIAPPMMLVAQQPQFGFFGRTTW
jgi:hypothetical protein